MLSTPAHGTSICARSINTNILAASSLSMSCVGRHMSFQSLISFQMVLPMVYPTRDLVDLLLLNSHSVCATLRIWAAHPGFSTPPGWYIITPAPEQKSSGPVHNKRTGEVATRMCLKTRDAKPHALHVRLCVQGKTYWFGVPDLQTCPNRAIHNPPHCTFARYSYHKHASLTNKNRVTPSCLTSKRFSVAR